ncbi:FecR domain-containing protein [Mucilaginibacter sp.]|uniref:FecR family protein n=1 Tax=Mucilaginibacter sp. TaxID=1882438 RepID=UPI002617CFB9|nr:FecR domain-containing protein [Mucilaginibacter sp.]MDB4926030.1 FecR protein [Mucilaginibacter sp.]
MQQTRLEFLFHQHFNKLASSDEEEEFYLLIERHSNRLEVQELMEQYWSTFTPGDNLFSEEDRARIFQRIIGDKTEQSADSNLKEGSRSRIYRLGGKRWIAVAASLLLIISSGLLFYKLYYTKFENEHNTEKIPIGRHTATLTFANGNTINLSDTKSGVVIAASGLKYNDGSSVEDTLNTQKEKVSDNVQTKAEQLLVASTPTGGTYQIVLQDGTHVWLNAESKLEFPASFAGLKQRIVRLTGEAYFEVSKLQMDKKGKDEGRKIPFIVSTAEQKVEVLGTHFDISNYADEQSTRTTLMEGSVKVSAIGSSESKLLEPDQQAILNRSNQIYVHEIDAQSVIDWKNGEFVFNEESLESIMRKVSRWYGVKVVFTNAQIRQQPFSGGVSRFGNISQLISVLESTKLIKFKVEGKQLTISPF